MNTLIKFILRIPNRVKYRLDIYVIPAILSWKITLLFNKKLNKKKPHGLKSPLIISLTSYPARFNTLPLTLKCLLRQSMVADKVILWIAHQDKQALTPSILELQEYGLEILYCDDLRSFKKIIPTLQAFPRSFVVTADDDVYYWPTWLEELVLSFQEDTKNVICNRGHRIRLGEDGLPMPYIDWEYETKQIGASPLNLPTGVAGVLYPPDIFHSNVLDVEKITRICPCADDVWLYWMIRLNGGMINKRLCKKKLYFWKGTQESGLWQNNVIDGGNDIQIKEMLTEYNGKPFK